MSVSIGPTVSSADAQLWSAFPTANFGSGATSILGNSDSLRAIMNFDLSAIPPSAKVLAADLSLVVTSLGPAPQPGYFVRRLTRRDWVEAQCTWNIYATGNAWTTAGGDFTTDDQGSYSAPGGTGAISHTDAPIIAQVQFGVRTAERLVAFMLMPDSSSGNFVIGMKEHATSANRPTLAVTYVVPKRRSLLGVGR
jgi:hypothetical protein